MSTLVCVPWQTAGAFANAAGIPSPLPFRPTHDVNSCLCPELSLCRGVSDMGQAWGWRPENHTCLQLVPQAGKHTGPGRSADLQKVSTSLRLPAAAMGHPVNEITAVAHMAHFC